MGVSPRNIRNTNSSPGGATWGVPVSRMSPLRGCACSRDTISGGLHPRLHPFVPSGLGENVGKPKGFYHATLFRAGARDFGCQHLDTYVPKLHRVAVACEAEVTGCAILSGMRTTSHVFSYLGEIGVQDHCPV